MLSETPIIAEHDSPLEAESRSSLDDVFKQDEDSLLSLSDQIKDYSIFEVILFLIAEIEYDKWCIQ